MATPRQHLDPHNQVARNRTVSPGPTSASPERRADSGSGASRRSRKNAVSRSAPTPSSPNQQRRRLFRGRNHNSGWQQSGWLTQLDTPFFKRLGDVSLAGIIFAAPLILGGRHPVGRLVYIVLVTLFMASWLGERFCKSTQRWRWTGVEWILLSGGAILILQAMQLTPEALSTISPHLGELVPHWDASTLEQLGLSNWSSISLTPYATRLALGVYVAHVTLFLTLVQRFQDFQQIRKAILWMAAAAIAMAVIALIQWCSGTEKFLGFIQHPSRPANVDVTGTFANSNHFAHFLALGIGPLVWWLSQLVPQNPMLAGPTGNTFQGPRQTVNYVRCCLFGAIPVVILAGLLSHSRGGIIAILLATIVSVGLLSLLKQLRYRAWITMGAIGVVVIAALTFHGYQDVKRELSTLTSGSIQEIDDSGARQKIWMANWELIKRFPLLGTGVGSHAEVYPKFFPHRSMVEFTHAESGYLQVLTETGMVGGALLLTGILCAVGWAYGGLKSKDSQRAGAAAAVAATITTSIVHSIADFPWYLTSCMSFAIIAAAAACSLAQHQHDKQKSARKSLPFQSDGATEKPAGRPWLGLAWVVLLISLISSHIGPAMASPHWDRYLNLALNSRDNLQHQLLESADAEKRAKKIEGYRHRNARQMAIHLENCLRHYPHHPRANARMTAVCLRLFEDVQKNSQNAMGLEQIRDAAIASQFPSREKLGEWLDVAIGKPRLLLDMALSHCLANLQINPADGRCHVYLAQVSFLPCGKEDSTDKLFAAAEHVRPNDAFVLFEQGRRCAARNDLESTLAYWERSFAMSTSYRDEIIKRLAPQLPAPLLLNILKPDERGMEELFGYYRKRKMMVHASVVGIFVADAIQRRANEESGVAAGKLWNRCRGIYRFLERDDDALRCAIQAARVAPNWLDTRKILAEEYMIQQDYTNAIQQYQWCQMRRPLDDQIRQRINIAQTLLAKQDFARNSQSGRPASHSQNHNIMPDISRTGSTFSPSDANSLQR